MERTKVRKSNLELLRIISMILIVMSHCDELFGLETLYSRSLGINKIITDWFHIGGQIGVGCFVLLSGYFMVEQKVSARKVMKLLGQVWFYTIGMWIIWVIQNVCQGQMIVKDFIEETVYAFFPVLSSHYWFVTAYVILLILSPFFNKLIFSLDERQYRMFLGSLLTIFIILKGGIPTVCSDILPEIFSGMSEGRLIPVFIIYFVAGYIKKYGEVEGKRAAKYFVAAIVLYLLLFATFYCFTYLGIRFDNQAMLNNRYFYRRLDSPFVVGICVLLFKGCLELDIKYNGFINKIASCTFGIYLLHSNRIMIEYISTFFPIYKETRPLLIFAYSTMAMISIYVAGILVDCIRKISMEKVWIKILDRYLEPAQKRIKMRIKE